MPNFEDVIRIFHEPGCPGIIVSVPAPAAPTVFLHCAECRACVGTLDEPVFRQLIELLSAR